MVKSTIKSKGITVGFSKVSGNSFFSQYQLIDFLAIVTANAGAFGWGKYWSGTGQNLAYLKSDYTKINGFNIVRNEISGDDMYLVQAISRLKKGYIHIDPNSHVKTKAMNSIKEFINQRIRWSSNSKSNFKNAPIFFMFLFIENIFGYI